MTQQIETPIPDHSGGIEMDCRIKEGQAEKEGVTALEIEGKQQTLKSSPELTTLRKIGIVLGIYTFFLMYGISQEHVFEQGQDGDKFRFGNFMIFCVALSNLVFAACSMIWTHGSEKTREIVQDLNPDMLQGMASVSLTSTIAMISTASALKYVSLPTQVLMKSAKSVPVMVGNFVRGRRYPWYDNVAVLMVSTMLVSFNLSKPSSKDAGSNSLFGLGLLCLSLIMDGLTGPNQDIVVEKHQLSPEKLMLVQNAFSMLYSFILWWTLDGFLAPLQFLQKYPETLRWLVIYCLCGMGGQRCIYEAIVHFGSLYVSLITTVRKFFTVLLSVLLFGHALNLPQWGAVFGIFFALALQSLFKYQAKQKRGHKGE